MELDKDELLKTLDYLAKINLWLLKRYGDDLYKEFEIDGDYVDGITKAFNEIYKEQCKTLPLPWYEYGLGWKEE